MLDQALPARPRSVLILATIAFAPALAGCQTTPVKKALALISPRYDESLSEGMLRPEDSTPSRFLSRYLTPSKTPHASSAREPKSLTIGKEGWTPVEVKPDPVADEELDRASRLYRQGKHEEAEPLLAAISKKRKGTPWAERAQYLLAESYFQRGKYFWANDAYDQLVKDAPGSQMMNKVATRKFEIATKWLASDEPDAKAEDRFTLADRLGGRAPLIDTGGYALKALEGVTSRDTSGPLADDALMKTGDYHYKHRDYESASLYYDQLISTYAKSELFRKAQLAGIDSRLKGYMGPEYDGAGLEQAVDMIRQTITTFPDRSSADGERLYKTLDLIEDENAKRAYTVAQHYRRKSKFDSSFVDPAEYYFGLVAHKWPKSDWAKKSRDELAVLAKMPRKQAEASKIMTLPASRDSFDNGGNTSGLGTNGAGTGMAGMPGGLGGLGGPG